MVVSVAASGCCASFASFSLARMMAASCVFVSLETECYPFFGSSFSRIVQVSSMWQPCKILPFSVANTSRAISKLYRSCYSTGSSRGVVCLPFRSMAVCSSKGVSPASFHLSPPAALGGRFFDTIFRTNSSSSQCTVAVTATAVSLESGPGKITCRALHVCVIWIDGPGLCCRRFFPKSIYLVRYLQHGAATCTRFVGSIRQLLGSRAGIPCSRSAEIVDKRFRSEGFCRTKKRRKHLRCWLCGCQNLLRACTLEIRRARSGGWWLSSVVQSRARLRWVIVLFKAKAVQRSFFLFGAVFSALKRQKSRVFLFPSFFPIFRSLFRERIHVQTARVSSSVVRWPSRPRGKVYNQH